MTSCPKCSDKSCSHVKAIVKKYKDGKGGPGLVLPPGLPPSPTGSSIAPPSLSPPPSISPSDPMSQLGPMATMPGGMGNPSSPAGSPMALPGALPGTKMAARLSRPLKATSRPHTSTRGIRTIGKPRSSPKKMGLLKSTLRGGGKMTNAFKPRGLTRMPKF